MLYFVYYEELKGADVALVLGIPENTVKTRLRKAKQLLKVELATEEWETLAQDFMHT